MASIAHRTTSLASVAVVVGLLASACGASTSPSATRRIDDTRRHVRPVVVSAFVAPSLPAVAPSDAWLVVGTAGEDTLEVIVASTHEKDYDLPVGVPEAHLGRLIVAAADGTDTRVQALVVQPGFGGESQTVPGAWRLPTIGADPIPAGVSADGSTIVLVPALAPGGAASSSTAARESRFAIVDRAFDRAARVISLPGAFEYDAISPDGATVYVVEHLPAPPVAHYQVRAVDVASGRLREGVVVDKANVDEEMGGYPIAQVRRRRRHGVHAVPRRRAPVHPCPQYDRWLGTVHRPTGHVAPTATPRAWTGGSCEPVDREHLVAANATLGMAVDISIADLAVSRTKIFSPTAVTRSTLAKFGHQQVGPAGRRLVVAPDGATVYAAGAHGIVRLSSRDLGLVGTLAAGTAIDSLAVTPDGRTVYALTRTDGRILQIDTASGVGHRQGPWRRI